MIRFAVFSLLPTLLGTPPGEAPTGRIEVPSMLIQLIEQVNVPAKVTGVLVDVVVHEGRIVKEGDLLAQVMDTEARLAEARAKAEVDIARMNAENDISVRFAKKSAEVAQADLRRALASIERYPKSVPESELDRLRLMVERAVLEVEQAGRDFEIAGHTQRVKESLYELARYQVEQRRITAPLGGVVVQVNRFRGEWVEPGDTVVRILRVDRVRAEGFLKLPDVRRDLQGQPITLTVDLPDEVGAKFPGKIVFLSPEIDPVNAQIRVWAEVENRGLRLRPGMRAKMTIEPSSPDRMGKE